MADLTTFVTEALENEDTDAILHHLYAHGMIEKFGNGELSIPVTADMGRDGLEILVMRNSRREVIEAFATIHYVPIEGE